MTEVDFMKRLNLNFDQFSKLILTKAGDKVSERLLSGLGDNVDLTNYIVIDTYLLSRDSSVKSELDQLISYLDKGVYGRIIRLRRGCRLIPVKIGATFGCFKLSGSGRDIYLVSRDEYLELIDNVKKFSATSKKGINK